MIWLYQPLLAQVNFPIVFYGIVNTCFVGCEIILMNSFHKLENLLGSKKRVIFLLMFVSGVFLLVSGIAGILSNVLLIIISIIMVIGFGFSLTPLFINYMNKHIPSSERATVLSTVGMFRNLAVIIMNLIIFLLEYMRW